MADVKEEKKEKLPLKEAEDKVAKWFNDFPNDHREAMKCLAYKILYYEDIRISRAEEIVRRSFKI